ncbi:DUF6361 family protein [Mycobacterium sp. SMC-17]|uniref:DUF6361 family protein n=1 Tax=Mycobacterium sp. SMC-17 TaxID=3381628 RepID=UPI0038777419
MFEVVDLFKEEGTVDELRVGSIRDATANVFFPRTSALHTRLRYTLFIPWLMKSRRRQTRQTDAGITYHESHSTERLKAKRQQFGSRRKRVQASARTEMAACYRRPQLSQPAHSERTSLRHRAEHAKPSPRESVPPP